jgi:hypothetical protein
VTPEEFLKIQRTLEQRALEQVAMLQRIAGDLNVIKWAACLCALFLILLVIK